MRNDHSFEEISQINMVPFIDIVLVILVIFMVTATFVTHGKIPLNLPNATSGENSMEDTKPVVLSITKDGELFYNDESITHETFESKVKELEKSTSIIIRSDAKTPFEAVVNVLDIFKRHEISRFAIQTIKGTP